MPLSVSIIVPAYNAATTLRETVASVRAQTHWDWELILVENGSSDTTLTVALELAATDARISAVSSPAKGVSVARNHGLQLARFDWVLFLDADDWILPDHLCSLLARLEAEPALDAVHCGWRRVSPEGETMFEEFGSDDADLFPLLARTCPFAIHACIVRRALVQSVGGFDPSLRTCEDWDLWQRIARTGARFSALPEILACYRARPHSASMNGRQMFGDGFKVIARAFGSDPRVPNPIPHYAQGLPPATLPTARLDNLIWQAGLILGSGADAAWLLDSVATDPVSDVNPEAAALSLFEACLLPTARPPEKWSTLYHSIQPQLARFLGAVEAHTAQRGLARCMQVYLERRAVQPASVARPLTVGQTHAIALEVTQPFADILLPPSVERLCCRVELEGDRLGELELPVCDGVVPADVLADAVAAEFSWPILRRFFARTIYSKLTVMRDANGWSVYRGPILLAGGIEGGNRISWTAAHDHVGWPIFIQEAWGLLTPPDAGFYTLRHAERRPEPAAIKPVDAEWLVVDLLDPLPEKRPVQPWVDVVLAVAGVPVTRTPLTVPRRLLLAATVRAALSSDSGYELCRVCVREGLLQQPLTSDRSLRERLVEAREKRLATGPARPVDRSFGTVAPRPAFVPRVNPGGSELVLWPRHAFAPCGSSASRRALLPQAAFADVHRMAAVSGEALVGVRTPNGSAHPVLYAPELLLRPPERRRPAPAPVDPTLVAPSADPRYFEELFTARVDPWDYTSPYEQAKYQQTLDLLPARRIRRALELACAEGHFTAQLAPRVDHLLATDVSQIALERTRRRCAAFGQVDYQLLDLVQEPLPAGRFDLIVCSEVLYYTGSRGALELVAENISAALEDGGYLVCAHAHVRADDPGQPGFEWGLPFGARTISDVFQAVQGLLLIKELRTPLYRVQLYRRSPSWQRWLPRSAPRVTTISLPAPLPAHVAAQVNWTPSPPEPPPTLSRHTDRLPILMYHRVATDGPASLERYRISPAQFESQLQYLREQGYQTATLEEWRVARETKRPLPGKRVMLTFDDGCVDFLKTAWPLLERYDFGAIVFLPTDEMGGVCRWDARHGAPAPIMSWADIRRLRQAGVEFGSHTATHPLLTGLSLEEMAREALRSRAALEEQLGESVISVAYPFGACDRVVECVFGACGYVFGLTCDHRPCETEDRLLALPRLEVSGSLDPDGFAELLLS